MEYTGQNDVSKSVALSQNNTLHFSILQIFTKHSGAIISIPFPVPTTAQLKRTIKYRQQHVPAELP